MGIIDNGFENAANDNGGYEVLYQGRVVSSHVLFVDAWLDAKLNYSFWTLIRGPEGTWVVNPYPREVVATANYLLDLVSLALKVQT